MQLYSTTLQLYTIMHVATCPVLVSSITSHTVSSILSDTEAGLTQN